MSIIEENVEMGTKGNYVWYDKYIHSEKYDLSKWDEYRVRIRPDNYDPLDEGKKVKDNMRSFYEAGLDEYPYTDTLEVRKQYWFYFFNCLPMNELITEVSQNYILKDEDELPKELSKCKVLIVTANENERNILHYKIMNTGSEITRIIYGNVAFFIFQWGAYNVVHVHQHQMGSNRDLGMWNTLENVFSIFRPNVVFSMGVAFGIDPTAQNIGDVLVSHKVFPYSENKIYEEVILPDRSQDKVIDNWLDVRFVNTTGFLEGVTYGSILSGESVLSSDEYKTKVCRAYSKQDFIVGGEMEGSALFQICASYDIPCAVIKGICDWASLKNGIFCADSVNKTLMKQQISEEEKAAQEKESILKTCAQAFAMTQVFEKCDVLFRDSTIFSHPKTRAVDAERRTSRILASVSLLTNLFILGVLFVHCLELPTLNFEIPSLSPTASSLIAIVSVASLLTTAFVYFYRKKH